MCSENRRTGRYLALVFEWNAVAGVRDDLPEIRGSNRSNMRRVVRASDITGAPDNGSPRRQSQCRSFPSRSGPPSRHGPPGQSISAAGTRRAGLRKWMALLRERKRREAPAGLGAARVGRSADGAALGAVPGSDQHRQAGALATLSHRRLSASDELVSWLLVGPWRRFSHQEILEQRPVVHHRGPQILGVRFAASIALRDVVCRAIFVHNVRMVD